MNEEMKREFDKLPDDIKIAMIETNLTFKRVSTLRKQISDLNAEIVKKRTSLEEATSHLDSCNSALASLLSENIK